MKAALQKRFGEHRVKELPVADGDIPLLILDLELKSPVTVIMTNGLSQYRMPVPEKHLGQERCELYFCLPSYWDWEKVDIPGLNWPFQWIQRLGKHLLERETWYGAGHTFPCSEEGLSETMKQSYFMLSNPILLEDELAPISDAEGNIHFLAIVPLFKKEFEYKQSHGTVKLLRNLNTHGVSEKLDDFRGSAMKRRWRLGRH
jgi:hypothetical protein